MEKAKEDIKELTEQILYVSEKLKISSEELLKAIVKINNTYKGD